LNHPIGWIIFNAFVFLMLFLDLKVFHAKAHEIRIKEALLWSVFWTVLALLFNGGVYFFMGRDAGMKFFAGYLLERALSFDNLFVFLLVFTYFKVPGPIQHKALFWGIIGALVMRALFIMGGIALIHAFHQVMYVFGAFLIYTGFKLLVQKDKEMDLGKNPAVLLFRRFMPVTEDYHGEKFFVREKGRLHATPLFVVLLLIESTDVIFAVDSIPAILGVTTDPFLVYTSNIFAILGLRALYFALAALMKIFQYLNYGLSLILTFVGVKMLIAGFYEIPIGFSLGVIAGILALSMALSLLFPKKVNKRAG